MCMNERKRWQREAEANAKLLYIEYINKELNAPTPHVSQFIVSWYIVDNEIHVEYDFLGILLPFWSLYFWNYNYMYYVFFMVFVLGFNSQFIRFASSSSSQLTSVSLSIAFLQTLQFFTLYC